MKVVFLDFDGVLNRHYVTLERLEHGYGYRTCIIGFDPVNITPFNEFIDQTDAKIVVSSAWRKNRTPDELQALLSAHDIHGEVIDKTPSLGTIRGAEILAWLNIHNDVEGFVIIDDSDDMGLLTHKLVKTSSLHGFQKEHVAQALAVLHQPMFKFRG